mgnify:CR=1 FL=1
MLWTFEESTRQIAKKIKEGYYDLENDSCGIKKGKDDSSNSNNVILGEDNSNDRQEENKKNCC